jgi:hypothetical protein
MICRYFLCTSHFYSENRNYQVHESNKKHPKKYRFLSYWLFYVRP